MRGILRAFKARPDLILPLILSIAFLVMAIAYWGAASRIGSGNCESWSNGCGGHYLPWPADGSGLICLAVTVPMDFIDRFFCLLVITKLYIPLVIGQIVSVAWIGRMVSWRIFPPMAQESSQEIET